MATDDTGSQQEASSSILESAKQANEELGTSFATDEVEAGTADSDASEESGDEPSPSASDETNEVEGSDNDNDSEEPQESPDDGDETPSGEGDESDQEGDEGPVPYERFAEVNEKKNELEEENEQLVEENEELQNFRDYYLYTEDGQQELLDFLKQEGDVEVPTGDAEEDSTEDSLEDAMEILEQTLPADAAEAMRDIVEQTTTQANDAEDGEDETSEVEDYQRRRAAQKIESLKRSEDHPHAEEIFDPNKGENGVALADIYISENNLADEYLLDTGLPDPAKMEQLYNEAKADYGFGDEPDNQRQQTSGTDGELTLDDLPDDEVERLKQEALEDTTDELEDNAENEPLEPTGGTSTNAGESSGDQSLKDAIADAKEEVGL